MNKLKTLLVIVFATATVAVGALAAAPSASALIKSCAGYETQGDLYYGIALTYDLAGATSLASQYYRTANFYYAAYEQCEGSLFH